MQLLGRIRRCSNKGGANKIASARMTSPISPTDCALRIPECPANPCRSNYALIDVDGRVS
jgi:hypothetical protein